MNENGVQTNFGANALHCLTYYRERYGYEENDFPVARKAYEKGLALPCGPHMSNTDIEYICGKLLADYQLGFYTKEQDGCPCNWSYGFYGEASRFNLHSLLNELNIHLNTYFMLPEEDGQDIDNDNENYAEDDDGF